VEYRSIRLLDSDGAALTGFDDRVTLNPLLSAGVGLRANARDIVPNSGLAVVTRAEIDVKTEDVVTPARSWRTDGSVYLPLFPDSPTRATLLFGILWQNRGTSLSTETFLPRGYDEDDVFLGKGTFLKSGLEVIQPVAFPDRGIILMPISIQAIYLYGFVESVGQSLEWRRRSSSAGGGLGIRVLLGHHIGLDLRLGVGRLLEERKWRLTGR
jgi:hypothetical protein